MGKKTRKRFSNALATLCSLVLAFALVPSAAFAQSENEGGENQGSNTMPWSGEGTEESPYLIEDAQDLADLATLTNEGNTFKGVSFSVTKDIDLSSVCYEVLGNATGDLSWTPIGVYTKLNGSSQYTSTYFAGYFHGNGHTISNLYIHHNDTDMKCTGRYGLFGQIMEGAQIDNLIVEGSIEESSSTGDKAIGGVVGYILDDSSTLSSATITNVVNRVSINKESTTTVNAYFGGIVGFAYSQTQKPICVIDGCANEATINNQKSSGYSGGLVGWCCSASVTNSYNTGDVYGNYAGGIGGYDQNNCTNRVYKNLYNAGKIYGSQYSDPISFCWSALKNISNVYTIDDAIQSGTATGGSTTVVKSVKASELKSAVTAASLGSGFAAVEGSYPILAWQATASLAFNSSLDTVAKSYGKGVTADVLTCDVAATGADGAFSYQWYTNSSKSYDGATAIENATEKTYEPSTATVGDAYYYCIASYATESHTYLVASGIASIQVVEGTAAVVPILAELGNQENMAYDSVVKADGWDITAPDITNESEMANVTYEFQYWTGTSDPSEATINTVAAKSDNPKVAHMTQHSAVKDFYYRVKVTNSTDNGSVVSTYSNVAHANFAKTIEINSTDEFIAWANTVALDNVETNNRYEGITIRLNCDIDLSDQPTEWAIGWDGDGVTYNDYKAFEGTLDGQGHSITIKKEITKEKATTDASNVRNYASLFYRIYGEVNGNEVTTIKNLVLKGSYNVYCTSSFMGGALAFQIAGNQVNFENVGNEVDVNVQSTGSAPYVSGFGFCENSTTKVNFTNCYNKGDITVNAQTGYVAGFVTGNATFTLTNCYNTGNITRTGGEATGSEAVAGFIATGSKAAYHNCYNAGKITTSTSEENQTVSGGRFSAYFQTRTSSVAYDASDNCYVVTDNDDDGGDFFGTVGKSATVKNGKYTTKAALLSTGASFLGSAYTNCVDDNGVICDYPALAWENKGSADSPVFTSASLDDQYVVVNKDATAFSVECTAKSGATIAYQWYVAEDADGTNATQIDGESSASYKPKTDTVGKKYYSVKATASWEDNGTPQSASIASPYALCCTMSETAAATPVIATQPVGKTYKMDDTTLDALSIEMKAFDEATQGVGTISYQWYKNDSSSTEGAKRIKGATDAAYTPSLTSGETKYFYCVITNTFEGGKTASVTSDIVCVKKQDTLYIGTAEEFIAFRDSVNNGNNYSGLKVKLTADIDLAGDVSNSWTAIGPKQSYAFAGTFDGGYHTISGLYSTSYGLFGYIGNGAVIKNLFVEGNIVNPTEGPSGGIVGTMRDNSTIENCGSYVNISLNNNQCQYIGGIAGSCSNKTSHIKNCFYGNSDTTLTVTGTSSRTAYMVGGIAGYASLWNTTDIVISNCYNAATITFTGSANSRDTGVGGITGSTSGIENCYNIGTVSSTTWYYGGISGRGCYWGETSYGKEINSYYLNTSCSCSNKSQIGAVSKTETEMKSQDFAKTLGDAFTYVEGSYPQLTSMLSAGMPVITSQPQGGLYYLTDDSPSDLVVVASTPLDGAKGSDGKLTYQWYKSTDAQCTSPVAITDATNASYTPNIQNDGTTYYYCVVTNTFGEEDNPTTLSVKSEVASVIKTNKSEAATISITEQPKSQTVKQHQSVTLSVGAKFADNDDALAGEIKYQWYSCDDERGTNPVAIAGATGKNYTYDTSDLGSEYYFVKAVNYAADTTLTETEVTSSVAKVTVETFTIASAEDMYEFANLVTYDGVSFAGDTVELTADIDLSSYEKTAHWHPIMGSNYFAGNFEGNGHIISGMTIDKASLTYEDDSTNYDYLALFGKAAGGATFSNFVVKGSVKTYDSATESVPKVAGIVADFVSTDGSTGSDVKFTNVGSEVDFEANSIINKTMYVGGLVAYNTNKSHIYFDSCYYNGDAVSNNGTVRFAGMLADLGNYAYEYKNCYTSGSYTNSALYPENWNKTSYCLAVGVVGSNTTTFENCLSTLKVTFTTTPSSSSGFAAYIGMADVISGFAGTASNNVVLEGSMEPIKGYDATDNYALDVSSETAGISTIDVKHLKASNAAATLGKAYVSGVDGVNSGYPILSWQREAANMPLVSLETKTAYDYIINGEATPLTVSATAPDGADGVTYQWYKSIDDLCDISGDEAIDNETNASYTPDITSIGTAYYYCVVSAVVDDVTYSAGSASTCVSVYSSLTPVEPVIIAQPTTINYVEQGQEALLPLTVLAEEPSDGGTLTYQWYAATDKTATKSVKLEGETSNELTVYNGKVNYNYYYCELTNTVVFNGEPATTTVKTNVVEARIWSIDAAAPVISAQPAGCQIYTGEDAATLSVTASTPENVVGSDGKITYQWYQSTDAVVSEDDVAVSGGAGSTLKVTSDKEVDNYYYYCVVTNTFKTYYPTTERVSTTTSDIATVNVITRTDVATPEITKQPADVTLQQHKDGATLSVEATTQQTGLGEITYQWYVSSTDSNTEGTAIKDATESTYELTASDLGTKYYYCVVTNTFENIKVASVTSETAKVTTEGYQIGTAKELKAFAKAVNAGDTFAGVTVELTADIDLSSVCNSEAGSWTSIGYAEGVSKASTIPAFSGTFDGMGHTISGFYQENVYCFAGLFGVTKNATIKNFTIDGTMIIPSGKVLYAGGAVGYAYNTVFQNIESKVKFDGSSATGSSQYVGGIVGYINYLTPVTAASSVTSCAFTGSVQYNSSTSRPSGYVGGIVGYGIGNYNAKLNIESCYNAGSIEGSMYIAGIIAYPYNYVYISNCYNSGTITRLGNTDTYFGEIMARNASSCTNCYYIENGCIDNTGAASSKATYSGTYSGCTVKTAEELTADSFAETLGTNFAAGDIYPVLTWQAAAGTPVAVEQPESTFSKLGETCNTLTFKAALPSGTKDAATKGKITYQWYKVVDGSGVEIASATESTYTPTFSETGETQFYCVATNTYTANDQTYTRTLSSKTVTYTVVPNEDAVAPTISTQPANVEVVLNESASLSIEATLGDAKGELSYQWYSCDENGENATRLRGYTAAAISAPASAEAGDAYYYCVATNTINGFVTASTKSDVAKVTTKDELITKIYTAAQFKAFAASVNSGTGYKGQTVTLEADIDLSEVCSADLGSWTAIGGSSVSTAFKGTFDGKGHAIKNLYGNFGTNSYQGLFSYISGATLKNFTITGHVTSQSTGLAGVVGYADGNNNGAYHLQNIVSYVDVDRGDNTTGTWNDAAGILAYGTGVNSNTDNPPSIDHCVNYGDISSCGYNVAGIAARPNANVTYCANYGDVTSTNTQATVRPYNFGTIVAYNSIGNYWKAEVAYNYNAGKLSVASTQGSGAYQYGGMFGYMQLNKNYNTGDVPSLHDNINFGSIEYVQSSNSNIGSFCGYLWIESADYVYNNYELSSIRDYATELNKNAIGSSSTSGITIATITEDELKASSFIEGLGSEFMADSATGMPKLAFLSDACRVSSQPESASYEMGADAKALTYECLTPLSGDFAEGTLTYQWYANTVESTKGSWAIEGETESSYTPATTDAGVMYYYCVVTNTVKETSLSATSNIAQICVTSETPVAVPVIISQPSSAKIELGKSVDLSISAAAYEEGGYGVGTISYQWYLNNSAIKGATSNTLTVTPESAGTYSYTCVVTNTYEGVRTESTTSDAAVITVPKAEAVGEDVIINNLDDFLEFWKNSNSGVTYEGSTIYLNCDIDLSTKFNSEKGSFTPLFGTDEEEEEYVFKGTFNGNYHTIKGLYINYTEEDWPMGAGLFGHVNGGTIQNLYVEGSVTAEYGYYIGGVVGYAVDANIKNVCSSVTVKANLCEYVGGVVGFAGVSSTDIKTVYENCINKGSVSGKRYVGGVLGRLGAITVQGCYNTGAVSSSWPLQDYTGGIVGYSTSSVAFLYDSYNTGVITNSGTQAGEVAGKLYSTDNARNLGYVAAAGSKGSDSYATAVTDWATWITTANTNLGSSDFVANGTSAPTLAWEETAPQQAKLIGDAIIAPIAEQQYTGSAIEPAVSVRLGTEYLKQGEDFTVTYKNNTEVGTATATVKGAGLNETLTFNIIPANLSNATIASIGAQQYTGSAIEPVATVSINGNVLVEGTDYTVEYANNTVACASTAENAPTVTITGMGNYYGVISAKFEITANPANLEEEIATATDAPNDYQVSTDGTDVYVYDMWVSQDAVDTLNNAISAAQTVADNAYATPEELSSAKDTLAAAVETFNDSAVAGSKVAEKGELSGEIETAVKARKAAIVSTDGSDVYPYDKWVTSAALDALVVAISAANEVAYDDYATPDEVAAAKAAIIEAVETFNASAKAGTMAVSHDELKDAIDAAVDVLAVPEISTDGKDVLVCNTWVTQATFDALTSAIAAANKVCEDEEATATDVANAEEALNTAVETFKDATSYGSLAVDKSELLNEIEVASELKASVKESTDGTNIYAYETWVTEDIKDALTIAISEGKKIAEDDEATPEEVEEAVEALKTAVKNVNDAAKAGTRAVSFDALSDKISIATEKLAAPKISVKGTDVKVYNLWTTQKAYDTFKAAIDAAKVVKNNASATQAEVDEAAATLATAMENFIATQTSGKIKKVGTTFTYGKATYKVTANGSTLKVSFMSTTATGSVSVPKAVTSDGVTYKVTTIAAAAFQGKTKITKVTIGANVVAIPAKAFYKNTGITAIYGAAGVKTIGTSAFSRCSKLATVPSFASVTTINRYAFYGCKSLKSFKCTSKSLRYIGLTVFGACTNLKTLTLSKTTALTKSGVNSSLRSSSVTTVKVLSSKVKTYKTYFTKANCGKTVTVKAV